LLRQSFAEPSAGFIRLGDFHGADQIGVGGRSVLLRQGGEASQFAPMEHTVLSQGGEAADYLSIASIDLQQVLIDVLFHASTPVSQLITDGNSLADRMIDGL
jgi:hypothetical protein